MKKLIIIIKATFHIVAVIWFLPPFCQYLVKDEPGIAFFILWFLFACLIGFLVGYSKED